MNTIHHPVPIRQERPTWSDLVHDVRLFHDSGGRPYACVPFNDHVEVHAVQGTGLKRWLQHRYFSATGGALTKRELEDAINTLSAQAMYEGREEEVSCRVAWRGLCAFLDVGDSSWQIIQISEKGWSVVAQTPEARFVRPAGALALPQPVRELNAELRLQSLFRLSDDQLRLIVAWMVLVMQHGGPYPVLYLCGEGASLLAGMIRSVVDPHAIPVRAVPQNERDLRIAAFHSWLVVLSIQKMPTWLANGLCNLHSGAALGTRENYQDTEEVVLGGRRPVILVGADRIPMRRDLLDLMLTVELPARSARDRKSDAEMREEMKELCGSIFGYLLNVLSAALSFSDYREPVLPRLAEFGALGGRLELCLWPAGSFARAYITGRTANAPIIRPLLDYARAVGEWSGSATDLLNFVSAHALPEELESNSWPEDAAQFGKQLRSTGPVLEELGIAIKLGRENGGKRDRIVTLGYLE